MGRGAQPWFFSANGLVCCWQATSEGIIIERCPRAGWGRRAMLSDWLPEFSSRRRIFPSYDSAHRPLAEKIAQTLKNDGHRVFFDKESLPPARDFNEQIRKPIRYSDRF